MKIPNLKPHRTRVILHWFPPNLFVNAIIRYLKIVFYLHTMLSSRFSKRYNLIEARWESTASGVGIGIKRLADTRCELGKPDKVGRRSVSMLVRWFTPRPYLRPLFRNWSLYLHRKQSGRESVRVSGLDVADVFRTNFTTMSEARSLFLLAT